MSDSQQTAQICGRFVEIRIFLNYGSENFRRRLSLKRPLARDHFVHRDAEAPDVGLLADRLPLRLFRRHVRCCAQNRPFPRR